MLENTHEGRCSSRCQAAHKTSRENNDNKDCKPIGHAHHKQLNDAQTRRHMYSHTPKSLNKKHDRKNKHVVGAGGGGGRDDAPRLEPDYDEDKATGRAAHQRTSRGESAIKSRRLQRGDLSVSQSRHHQH